MKKRLFSTLLALAILVSMIGTNISLAYNGDSSTDTYFETFEDYATTSALQSAPCFIDYPSNPNTVAWSLADRANAISGSKSLSVAWGNLGNTSNPVWGAFRYLFTGNKLPGNQAITFKVKTSTPINNMKLVLHKQEDASITYDYLLNVTKTNEVVIVTIPFEFFKSNGVSMTQTQWDSFRATNRIVLQFQINPFTVASNNNMIIDDMAFTSNAGYQNQNNYTPIDEVNLIDFESDSDISYFTGTPILNISSDMANPSSGKKSLLARWNNLGDNDWGALRFNMNGDMKPKNQAISFRVKTTNTFENATFVLFSYNNSSVGYYCNVNITGSENSQIITLPFNEFKLKLAGNADNGKAMTKAQWDTFRQQSNIELQMQINKYCTQSSGSVSIDNIKYTLNSGTSTSNLDSAADPYFAFKDASEYGIHNKIAFDNLSDNTALNSVFSTPSPSESGSVSLDSSYIGSKSLKYNYNLNNAGYSSTTCRLDKMYGDGFTFMVKTPQTIKLSLTLTSPSLYLVYDVTVNASNELQRVAFDYTDAHTVRGCFEELDKGNTSFKISIIDSSATISDLYIDDISYYVYNEMATSSPYISFPKFNQAINSNISKGDNFLVKNVAPERISSTETIKALDGYDSTSTNITVGNFIQMDFEKATSINNVSIKESGSRVTKYSIWAYNGEQWIKVYNNDLIENFHLSVLPDTVKTYALRLFIDEIKNNATAQIKEITVMHQRPISYGADFVNMGYLSSNYYLHAGWNDIPADDFKMMTDITMIGNFVFDKNANFRVINENKGSDNNITASHAANSPEAYALMDEWLKYIDDNGFPTSGITSKTWISITALKGSAFSGTGNAQTYCFNTYTKRANFISQVISFVQHYNLEGVDIDWE